MPLKKLVPVLLLCAAGCAQVPTETADTVLQNEHASQASRGDAQVSIVKSADTAIAPAPQSSRAGGMPHLQTAEALTHPIRSAQASTAAPAPVRNVWDRIRNGFALAPMDNELVREWENWYASRPDYVARMIARSSRYLFHIVEEVEKRKMPSEIALLPMIESAYNPVAYSKSHASGIWQFIPSTGKDYGLRQNWWYDGRRDVIAATTAALDYLDRLHNMFGDWPLALASYNWGEGAVGRAMERNRVKGLPTDYESLTVPAETRGYLPKLIAVKNIIMNPAQYGLEIADVPNEPFFETVTLKRHIDLKLAAKLAEMSVEEFKFLNPGHNKPVIRAGEAERIVLPKEKVATFLGNFEKHDRPLVSWQAVTLKAGQKPERVAAQHGMTLAELKQVNGLQNQKKLVVGQPLLVPVKDGVDEPQLPDLPATPVTLPKAIQAAKNAAQSRKVVQTTRGTRKVAVQKMPQKGSVRKVAAVKGRPTAQQQLRAEHAKRAKVVANKPATKQAQGSRQRVKVANR